MRLGRSKIDLGAHLGLPRPPKLDFGEPPRAMAAFGPSKKQGGSCEAWDPEESPRSRKREGFGVKS